MDAAPQDLPVIELRQYTLHTGQRDTLIGLFDRYFVEGQEALGMPILGQFRDLDRPDRFVWLRGFASMSVRAKALQDFYGGPIWKAHRQEANATMIDASNVLLLQPARPGSGFKRLQAERAPVGSTEVPRSVVMATVYAFESPVDDAFLTFFEKKLKPAVESAGLTVLAAFKTESGANEFPALPVREGEHVFVWFTAAESPEALKAGVTRLESTKPWKEDLAPTLKRRLKSEPEVLRLAPTARSRLRD